LERKRNNKATNSKMETKKYQKSDLRIK
jgi:hypothetical protein